MFKKGFFLALAVILAVVLLIPRYWQRWIWRFSSQGEIDPQQIFQDYDPEEKMAIFNNQLIEVPPLTKPERPAVLGQSDEEKRIEIDLTNQRLYAYEGDRQVFNFLVSSGKWGRTPTGIFRIWVKLRYSKMSGGSRVLRTYYYLPNVPFVMYFYNEKVPKSKGYGIHGTYWHNNFGHPMSHGCINMKTEEAAVLYYWALPDLRGRSSIHATEDNPGTTVIIYGEGPWE